VASPPHGSYPRCVRIDLNADLGEGMGDDDALLGIVTSANIATGAHAGGGQVLRVAVAGAAARSVAIGAHPSYPDRAGFGRASQLPLLTSGAAARAAFVNDLVQQVLEVASAAEEHGDRLVHVKAHGSLYNDSVAHDVAARVVLEAVVGVRDRLGHPVAVVTQPAGRLAGMAEGAGVEVVAEGFVDRAYASSGGLVPRGTQGAVHSAVPTMVGQAIELASGRIRAVDGTTMAVRVQSLCVHGDTPGAVRAAREVRSALERGGWRVGPAHLITESDDRVLGSRGAPRLSAFGDRALLVEPADGVVAAAETTRWVVSAAARTRELWPGAVVVPGLASVLVSFDHPGQLPAALGAAGEWLTGGGADPDGEEGGGQVHELRTSYDGPDLAALAALLRLPTGELVARHESAKWTVAALGFAPGFAYLHSDDPLFHAVPRRPEPRPRVPPGSVALASGMCAVYPDATPGGWQLIGTTEHLLFDPGRARPATLAVGDGVRFDPVP
jgi:UPF0271 protein